MQGSATPDHQPPIPPSLLKKSFQREGHQRDSEGSESESRADHDSNNISVIILSRYCSWFSSHILITVTVISLSYLCHTPVIFLLYLCHISVISLSYFCHISVISLLYLCHIPSESKRVFKIMNIFPASKFANSRLT